MSIRPILITGAARSGTSMVAGIVHMCGAKGGVLSGPNVNNRKGMFENVIVRDHIVKGYLTRMGLDPLCQDPLPNVNNLEDYPNLRRDVICVLQSEGVDINQPWFYKGAKMCLVWPTWHQAFPDARWLIVRRSTSGIIGSCMRTSFMRAFEDREGWEGWVAEYIRRFEEMEVSSLDTTFVQSEDIINGDFSTIRLFVEACGLVWDKQGVEEFVSPELFKSEVRDGII